MKQSWSLSEDSIVMARTADPKTPRLAERLRRKKAQLDRERPLPPETVRRLNEDLRVFLTYHSNAIEGNTLSLRETQMVIDYGLTIGGHPLREYLEAKNHAAAYSYMAALVERQTPVTRETILELHRLVMDTITEDACHFFDILAHFYHKSCL
jgi:Fic family protein